MSCAADGFGIAQHERKMVARIGYLNTRKLLVIDLMVISAVEQGNDW